VRRIISLISEANFNPQIQFDLNVEKERLIMQHIKDCIANPVTGLTSKYWTLHDISSDIVSAYIQSRSSYLGATEHGLVSIATNIAELIMEQLPVWAESFVLLVDIVEVLSPLLAWRTGGDKPTWLRRYEDYLVKLIFVIAFKTLSRIWLIDFP
jgi:hypothetical protein